MSNANCLQGWKCPKCGFTEGFNVEVKTLAYVTDDGTDGQPVGMANIEWDEDSYCECRSCYQQGVVRDFGGF